MEGRASLARRLALGAGALLLVTAAALALAHLVPLPARLAAPPGAVVLWRDGSPAHVFLAPDERWRVAVRPAEVDPAYVRALLALEDARFRLHPGVDPLAVARALVQNVSRGRRVSGASTLTMQLVRVLEPRPRTLASKVVEALRAVQLEVRLSKDEVLAAYLQFTPYGRNLEGVEAASIAYFGHRADHLSAAEIATLLAVPQAPARRFPTPQNAHRLAAARDEVAQRLLSAGALPVGPGGSAEGTLAEVRATPAPERLRPFPREAPHAARYLVQRAPAGTSHVRSTLDAGLQRLAERRLREAAPDLAARGIHNAAAVVVERQGGAVRALVGNPDVADAQHAGEVASFAVPRSPGSALKPFVYALALDAGLVLPGMLVPDVPVVYSGYAPHNYDDGYQGLVRLEDALSQSLNIPFVQLVERLGVERFLGVLRRGGVTSLAPEPGHYGLSVAVGGLEVTPLEVAGLYLALANGGRMRPLRFFEDAPLPREEDAPQLASPGAAWLTRRALALRDRPDFPERRRLTGLPPAVHWKTGTSFGHRDAWAAGSGPTHTAVVWTGNLDQRPSVHLVGADAAAPLLFDLLEAVSPPGRVTPDATPPDDLVEVEVCAHSGHVPGPACPERTHVLALRHAVPTRACPFHVRLEVELATGLAVSPACRAGRITEARTFLRWPASVRRYLGDAERALPEPPAWAPGCEAGGAGGAAPAIISPAAGQVVLLVPGLAADRQEVPLEADGEGTLSWFVDGAFLGTVPADERMWWRPSAGVHELLAKDARGRSARRVLEVRERR